MIFVCYVCDFLCVICVIFVSTCVIFVCCMCDFCELPVTVTFVSLLKGLQDGGQ